MRILLIEDDKRLTNLIRQVLKQEGFTVDIAHDGDIGLELALRSIHDVAIIDWMLPGRDGPSICRSIRSAHIRMGILMLTARSQVEDRVAGLQTGADDYLVKPFAFDELVARVHALARRVTDVAGDPKELRVGSLILDLHTHKGRRGEHIFELTKTEWALLEYLMRNADQVLTRRRIMDYVWSDERDVQTTMVDVYISYLRNKLSLAGRPNPIETVRGIGYRLVADHA